MYHQGSLLGACPSQPGPFPACPTPALEPFMNLSLAASLLVHFGKADILVGWKKMKS